MFTEQPTLLHVLLAKLGHDGAALPPVTDSAVRFIEPAEVRPDAFFEAPDVPWIGVEVQGTEDDAKRRRWPLLVAIKLDQSTIMGDLVVITHSRALGKWARTCVVHRGPRGTVLTLKPVVLVIDGSRVEDLLDPKHPALALVAAWAMQDRHGPKAQAVVRRALDLAATVPEDQRVGLTRAILGVLNEAMLAVVRRWTMDFTKIPEGPVVKAFKDEGRAEGRVEGQRSTLLRLLARRGLSVSPAQKAKIESELREAVLTEWLDRVIDAPSVGQVLGAAPSA